VLSDGSAILLGIADWLTPNGNRIFGIGIKPDQTVALPTGGQPIDPTKLDTMTAGSVMTSGDSQLLAALTELNQIPK
jgi:carboxyl-terminal processing protease